MNDIWAKSMLLHPRAIRCIFKSLVGATSLMLGASGLSGCADFQRAAFLPPVNPESPVAAQVALGTRRNYQTPSFTNVPPSPKNVPTAPMVKSAVFTMVGCRRTFAQYDREHPPLWNDTAQFAELERSKVDLNPADVPTQEQDKASQAYADKMKAYASPPAPLPSGPAPTASELTVPPPKASSSAPAPAAVAAPKPSAHAARPAAPQAVAAQPALPKTVAAPPTALAPVTVLATSTAIVPPPAAAADPLLSHCQ